eukprot:COSAG05_NODE_13588_length_424_cov_0.960000_1_plen_51_part_10
MLVLAALYSIVLHDTDVRVLIGYFGARLSAIELLGDHHLNWATGTRVRCFV